VTNAAAMTIIKQNFDSFSDTLPITSQTASRPAAPNPAPVAFLRVLTGDGQILHR